MSEGSNGLTQAVVEDTTNALTQSLPQPPNEVDELAAEQQKSIFTKIRYEWRPEDHNIVERSKVLVDQEFAKLFYSAIQIFERFFGAMHVPETQWVGNQEVVLKDTLGRQVYKRGPDGHLIEDYSQLTGQDFEIAILRLEKLRLDLRPRISELLADAVYARNCAGDIADDAYHKAYDGTIADRTARANRASRMDRYHAFFRWALWQACKDFYDEIGQFITYLEKIRTWKSFER